MSEEKGDSRFAPTARWALVIVIVAIMVVGTLLPEFAPAPSGSVFKLPGDIAVIVPSDLVSPASHALGFGALGFALVLALKADQALGLWILAALLLGALSIELAQIPIPIRSFSWADVWASFFGGAGGILVGFFLRWLIH